jgi:hypothetical protein
MKDLKLADTCAPVWCGMVTAWRERSRPGISPRWLETGVTQPAPAHDDAPAAKPAGKPRKKARRNIGALPKHLPRCEQVLEPTRRRVRAARAS